MLKSLNQNKTFRTIIGDGKYVEILMRNTFSINTIKMGNYESFSRAKIGFIKGKYLLKMPMPQNIGDKNKYLYVCLIPHSRSFYGSIAKFEIWRNQTWTFQGTCRESLHHSTRAKLIKVSI